MSASRSTFLVLVAAWATLPARVAENWIPDGNCDVWESFRWQGGTWQAEVVHAGQGALRLDLATGANARHAPIEIGQAASQEVMDRHLAAEAGLSGAGFFTLAKVRVFPEIVGRHSQ